MSGRALAVLARFPAHLEAGRPGKLLFDVAVSHALPLDGLATDLASIRRAHRLADADELGDVLRIAALHGITRDELAVMLARFTAGRTHLAALDAALAAGDATARDTTAEALLDLWGIAEPAPRLPLFAPAPAGGSDRDLGLAARRLAVIARRALALGALVDAARHRIAVIARRHALGNGTVTALLDGAANALDLNLGPIVHDRDRFWHAAFVTDRMRLRRPRPDVPGDDPPSGAEIAPAVEVLGLEENPLRRETAARAARRHRELFSVLRRGFDRARLQVRVIGRDNRTVGPMVVNRDEGHGVGFADAVTAAETLVFGEDGRVRLDGTDVTSFAYAWRGACFGGADASPERDFVFDAPTGGSPLPARLLARRARFVEAIPSSALDSGFTFPHAGDAVPTPGVAVGETRFAFFVASAYASRRDAIGPPPQVTRVPPRPAVGLFDASVFDAAAGVTPDPAAEIELSWLEHEAYAVRVLVPAWAGRVAGDDELALAAVRRALARFKPAGVDVRVAYVDDRWVLGEGTLTSGTADDPISRLRSGTVLWTTPGGAPS